MTRLMLRRTLLALAMVSTALVALESPAAAVTQGPYYMWDRNSGKCIDNPAGNLRNNILMTIYTCVRGAYNEQWYTIDTEGQYRQIRNRVSGRCLTVQNASRALNAQVIQYTCSSDDNAEWYPWLMGQTPDGRDWYQLVNRNSQYCLTVRNASTTNGAALIQHSCDPMQAHHLWTWDLNPPG